MSDVSAFDMPVREMSTTKQCKTRRRTMSDVSVSDLSPLLQSKSDTFPAGDHIQPHKTKKNTTEYKRSSKQNNASFSSGTAFYTHVLQQTPNMWNTKQHYHSLSDLTLSSNNNSTHSRTQTNDPAIQPWPVSKYQEDACRCVLLHQDTKFSGQMPVKSRPTWAANTNFHVIARFCLLTEITIVVFCTAVIIYVDCPHSFPVSREQYLEVLCYLNVVLFHQPPCISNPNVPKIFSSRC